MRNLEHEKLQLARARRDEEILDAIDHDLARRHLRKLVAALGRKWSSEDSIGNTDNTKDKNDND